MMDDMTAIHDELQVALSRAWSSDTRQERRSHGMRATELAFALYKQNPKLARPRTDIHSAGSVVSRISEPNTTGFAPPPTAPNPRNTMTPQAREIPADVEHETSSRIQIVDVHDGQSVSKILIDLATRATFPMDDVQWRELEMYVLAQVDRKSDPRGE